MGPCINKRIFVVLALCLILSLYYYYYFLFKNISNGQNAFRIVCFILSVCRPPASPFSRGRSARAEALFLMKKKPVRTVADQLFARQPPEIEAAHRRIQHDERMRKREEYARNKGIKPQ
jgi:hypothetical protein